MTDPLAGVHAKIERGFDHLNEFEAQIRAFLDDHPYEIAHKVDPDGWGHLGVFHIVKEPPLLLGILAGEAVGQFRSALDHLMTEVVRLRRPTEAGRVNFPIYTDETYRARSDSGGPSPRAQLARLVRPEHLAILDSLQPKLDSGAPAWPGGPRRGVLFVLQWLTNVDKHQLIHPVFAMPSRVSFHGYPHVKAMTGRLDAPYFLEEGTQLYHVLFADETNMEVPMDLLIDFALGPPPMMRMTVRHMRQFGGQVQRIVRQFREATPEFPGHRRTRPAWGGAPLPPE
jgi:hypothetical protein